MTNQKGKDKATKKTAHDQSTVDQSEFLKTLFDGLSKTLISTLNQKQNPRDSVPKKTNKNINERVRDVLNQNALFEQGDSADEASDSVNAEIIDPNFSMFSDEEVDQVEAHGYDEDFD